MKFQNWGKTTNENEARKDRSKKLKAKKSIE
jgi:hypothetical protein